jgi:hypothetical protein
MMVFRFKPVSRSAPREFATSVNVGSTLGADWCHVPEKLGFIEQTIPCILERREGIVATNRTAKRTTNRTSRSSVRFRSTKSGTFAVRFRKSSPTWKTNLENNLVKEGLSRSKARKLVKLAAS